MPGFPILRLCILTLRPCIPNGPSRSNLPERPAAAVPGFVPGRNAPAPALPATEDTKNPSGFGPDGFFLFRYGVGASYKASATT